MTRILSVLSRIHWLLLFIAAPFLVFPSPVRNLAMLVVPTLWVIYMFGGRIHDPRIDVVDREFPVTPLNISLLVLLIMLLISTWATYSMEQSLEKIAGLILGLGVFYVIVYESMRNAGWWRCLAAFLIGGMGWNTISLFGMEYHTRFSFLAPVIRRIPIFFKSFPTLGTGLQHNAVGGTLVWILPLMICLSWYVFQFNIENIKYKIGGWWKDKRFGKKHWGVVFGWVIRISVWAGTFFVGSVLLLTQSRGSYLAICVTALIGLLIILSVRWKWILTGILVLGLAVSSILISQGGGWEAAIVDLGFEAEAGFSVETLSARLEIWSRAINGLEDFPITGMGMNTFRELIHILYPLFTISSDIDLGHAHNEFLQAGLDLGLPGLISFISIYMVAFWMLYQVWRIIPIDTIMTSHSTYLEDPLLIKVLVLGLGGGLFAHLIFGMLDAITLGAKPGIFFWILLGLITGLYKQTINQSITKYKI